MSALSNSEAAAKVAAIQAQTAAAREADPLRDVTVDLYESRTTPETRAQFYARINVKNPGD